MTVIILAIVVNERIQRLASDIIKISVFAGSFIRTINA